MVTGGMVLVVSESVSLSFSHSDVCLYVYSVLTVEGNWGGGGGPCDQ